MEFFANAWQCQIRFIFGSEYIGQILQTSGFLAVFSSVQSGAPSFLDGLTDSTSHELTRKSKHVGISAS
jgi:hypothetical protein